MSERVCQSIPVPPTGDVTAMTYDDLDRISGFDDAIKGTKTLVYDANSNLIQETDALGGITRYEFDEANQMTRKIDDRSGRRVPVLDSPYRYSDASAGVRGLPAFRGEDNREVLSEVLGIDEKAIEDLERAGVISARVPEN